MENYNISLEEARKTGLYKFTSCGMNRVKEIRNILKLGKSVEEVMFVLEFGHIDIEMTIREDNILDYYVCIERSDDRFCEGKTWESFECVGTFKISDIESNEDKIEEDMFKTLMKCAKENNLTWSTLN